MKPRKCKSCQYKNATSTKGKGICSHGETWFPVKDEDYCHYLGTPKELTCGDCAYLNVDSACIGCSPDESAYRYGHLCGGFGDRRELEFNEILAFWLVHDMYDRKKIEKLLDEFEEESRRLCEE